ncbi:MAG: hypothetical protein WCC22_07525 [Terriglobales bacterium]
MIFTLAGMSQKEYFRGPFWATLPRASGSRPMILGISGGVDEKPEYKNLCAKHGEFFQFFLLNEDALKACTQAGIKLTLLGPIDDGALTVKPSLLLGTRRG